MQRQQHGLHVPDTPAVPPPAYLCCARAVGILLSSARHRTNWEQRNGQVPEGNFSFQFPLQRPEESRGVDIKPAAAAPPVSGLLWGIPRCLDKVKRGLCVAGECVPLRRLLHRAAPCSCYWWPGCRLRPGLPQAAPLPVCVSGSWWTAVGWGEAKSREYFRNGPCNCESS